MVRSFVLLGAALAALPTSRARAAGFYVPDVGVHALGRAGAFVARADDATAAWYNPAGFADQGGTRVIFESAFTKQSLFFQRTDAQGSPAGFSPIGNDAAPKFIPFLGISSDFGLKNLTFAFTGFGPFAKNTDLPEAGAQRYSMIHSRATEAFFQLSVGWRILPWLKVGGAFRGTYFNARQKLAISVLPEEGQSDGRIFYDVTDPFTVNAQFGLLLSPAKFLDIGVSYRLKTPIHAEGTLKVDENDLARLRASHAILSGLGIQGDRISVSLAMPMMLRAGVRFHQPRFDVEVDLVWERWDGFGRVELRPIDVTYTLTTATPQPLPTIVQERNYGDAYSIRVGGDVVLMPDLLTARLGYFYETSAVPEASLGVGLVDTDKHGFAVGLSARFGWFELSIAYSHVQLMEKRVLDSNVRQINLTYLALGVQDQSPVVGRGIYRAGWDNLAVGLAFDIDTAVGWTRRK